MRRRTFLSAVAGSTIAGSAAAAGGGVATGVGGGVEAASADGNRQSAGRGRDPVATLLPGTPHETAAYAIAGEESGPTAVVVGGMHGDERSGYLAAERLLDRSLRAGRLVVLPRANRVAIRRDSRRGEGGDLNRQFPPGRDPTTELAREIWEFLEGESPDVVANLHSSKGLYRTHAEFVGQAIFPTEAGDAESTAAAVAETLNDAVVPWYMPLHDYATGNVLRGTAPLLAHKVGADLGRPAYIVETTEYLVDAETGARWTERAAAELLGRHGVRWVEGER